MSEIVSEASLAPSRYRRLTKGWGLAAIVLPAIALLLAFLYVFHWTPFGINFSIWAYRFYLVAIFVPLCFMWVRATSKAPADSIPWYDILLIVLTMTIPLYFAYHEEIVEQWQIRTPPLATALGVILWVIMLEAGRRVAGPIFAGLIAFFSVYPLFGSYMPGILWAPNLPLDRVTAYHIVGDESLFGTPLTIFADVFYGFMVFGALVQMLGAGKFFTQVAGAVLGNVRAPAAKISCISSGLFGTISGSAVANVIVDGYFTIPAMKKEGFPPEFAGAVEATASTGGQIMPPIMGVSAFIMAQITGLPYAQVCIAAAVPAILYYICLFCHVDAQAARRGLKALGRGTQLPPLWKILLNNLHIILGVVALIVLLFYYRRATQAPWIGALAVLVFAMVRKENRPTLRWIPDFLSALGRILGELIGMMAPMGLIIGAFFITGIGYTIPDVLLGVACGNALALLLMGALASYILGMGANTVACYIFLAILLAPALVEMGFDKLASHLFVFYWGIMANITPPVAPAAIAAASIAGTNPMKTGLVAMRLAGAIYIVPFIFVFSPALLLKGPIIQMLYVIPITGAAFVLISGALEGYIWRIGNITMLSRVILVGAGVLIALPWINTMLYGIAILVVFAGLYYLLRKTSSPLLRILIQ